jgi:hypothetical protein
LIWRSAVGATKSLNENVGSTKPEQVKYLPQNYFENLTNEIETNELRGEIENVVYSHVKDGEKLGTSDFRELEDLKNQQSRADISALKRKLRALNIEIVKLESQADPNFRKQLEEKLKIKREELQTLRTSKEKDEVSEPDMETEEQKKISSEIAKETELLKSITDREKAASDRLVSLKSSAQKLVSLKVTVKRLDEQIVSEKSALRATSAELGIDIDKLLLVRTDYFEIDKKIASTNGLIEDLDGETASEFGDETDFGKVVRAGDLKRARDFVSNKIAQLNETSSAPQRRYQDYLRSIREIARLEFEILGDEKSPRPDTIRFLESKLRYLDTDLREAIENHRNERREISRSIFKSKLVMREFYEFLKHSVESRLDDVNSKSFAVAIDASFVVDFNFEDKFFAHINQAAKGPFRGREDGRRNLRSIMSEVNWNEFESVDSFMNGVLEELNKELLDTQIKDIKEFYDFLFSLEYFESKYELRLGGKSLNQLSPGEKGLMLLIFYLYLDKQKTPLIIDQPEDNLDNESIFSVLSQCIRDAKKSRQVILVTHNPNLAIGADAEQIIYVNLEKHKDYKFRFKTGSIENPMINEKVVKILEGTRPAFVQRRLKYQIR